jgi:hypothetical protein
MNVTFGFTRTVESAGGSIGVAQNSLQQMQYAMWGKNSEAISHTWQGYPVYASAEHYQVPHTAYMHRTLCKIGQVQNYRHAQNINQKKEGRMCKVISVMLLLLIVTFSMADTSAKAGDIVDAGICSGIAIAGYCQEKKTVYINFVAIFFTVKAAAHVVKAIFFDNN